MTTERGNKEFVKGTLRAGIKQPGRQAKQKVLSSNAHKSASMPVEILLSMEDIPDRYRFIKFILGNMQEGVFVFDEKMNIVYCNRSAELLLGRLTFPDEIKTVCRRMFDAVRADKFSELFPGEVNIYKRIEGSPSRWKFRLHIYQPVDEKGPLVYVFIHEESLSEKIDLSELRKCFKLTRREVDVMRRVINGLKNDDIAKEFDISEQTIKDHMSNVYQKIGVRNRVELLSVLFGSQLSPE